MTLKRKKTRSERKNGAEFLPALKENQTAPHAEIPGPPSLASLARQVQQQFTLCWMLGMDNSDDPAFRHEFASNVRRLYVQAAGFGFLHDPPAMAEMTAREAAAHLDTLRAFCGRTGGDGLDRQEQDILAALAVYGPLLLPELAAYSGWSVSTCKHRLKGKLMPHLYVMKCGPRRGFTVTDKGRAAAAAQRDRGPNPTEPHTIKGA